jgi:nicotinamidase/pyrazinamidase
MITKKALIMIDLQNDFCQGGSLPVPNGEKVISIANQLQAHFDLIIATKDWHPRDHMSFAANHPPHAVGDVIIIDGMPQILWPQHCVEDTKGAQFYPTLNTQKITKVFHKGCDKKIDSYSAFFDNAHQRATGLGDFLSSLQVEDAYILGLATDYCVKYSVLDAIHLGFNTYVIEDACQGVQLQPDDITNAYEEMSQVGAKIIHSKTILEK